MYVFMFPSCKDEKGGNGLRFTLSSQAPLVFKNPETTLSNSDGQTKITLNFCSFKPDHGFSTGININQNSELQEQLDNHVHSKEIGMTKNSQGLNKQDVDLISDPGSV